MLMPGRSGYSTTGGWAGGGVSSAGLPNNLDIGSRSDNEPLEYRAAHSIEFTGSFESGSGDGFEAFITTESGTGGGSVNGRDGAEGLYRYGFNGMEMDPEIMGEGNGYNTLNRIYDARIGRWLSIDPIIKHGESSYTGYHNNPIIFNDPLGDDPPKKPGFWTKLWRGAAGDYYKTRAEEFANKNKIDESNILDVGKDTWVVINNKNKDKVSYSIFRKSGKSLLMTSTGNDDYNLTEEQLLNTKVQGFVVLDGPAPWGAGASAAKGLIYAGSKSKSAVVGVLDKTADALEGYKKHVRLGIMDDDV
jgi:RHS repeat-associated protein